MYDYKDLQLFLALRKMYENIKTTSVGMRKHVYTFPGWFDVYFWKSKTKIRFNILKFMNDYFFKRNDYWID